ncbi:hypothetical protein BL107_10706 [Synechococcus sp. BL107]|nr:hypothetical protein BL107_10706 [Synechococcus sp. BL107]
MSNQMNFSKSEQPEIPLISREGLRETTVELTVRFWHVNPHEQQPVSSLANELRFDDVLQQIENSGIYQIAAMENRVLATWNGAKISDRHPGSKHLEEN